MAQSEIRRKDRILSDENEIREIIRNASSGVFGFVDHDKPYLNPNLFIYHENENCVYFHTAGQSSVKEVVQLNSNACFLIYDNGRLLPGPKATDLSIEYTSIMIFGKVEIVRNEQKIMEIFQAYIQKYFPELKEGSYAPFSLADAMKATMYRLSISKITAKQNRKPDDFPGAMRYEEKNDH
jgi:uncharacterized protein